MTMIRVANRQTIRCQRCGGNAYFENLDGPELRCLQCSRLIARLTAGSAEASRKLPAAA